MCRLSLSEKNQLVLVLLATLIFCCSYLHSATGKEVIQPIYIYQHVSRTGGGTITELLKSLNIASWFKKCFPRPCLTPWLAKRYDGIVISIRDPVDRFVATFDTQLTMLCHNVDNNVDSRTAQKQWFRGNWSESCRDVFPTEISLLVKKYKGDANELAESLCSRGLQAKIEAIEDIKKIGYLQHSLEDHLAGLQNFAALRDSPRTFTFNVAPLVRGFNFLELAKSAIESVIEDVGGPDFVSLIHKRSKRIVLNQSSPFLNTIPTEQLVSISKLSPVGECCITQYYSADYRILDKLLDTGCRGPAQIKCKKALQSILSRRYWQLTASEDDCIQQIDFNG